MRMSVGILAYNEEASIGKTVGSLFEQSWLKALPADVESLEVVVVPNGCTDGTSAAAARACEAAAAACGDPRVTARVETLEKGGKTNAWNEFVHRLSDQRSDYIVMLDGDIRIEHPDTVGNLVRTLEKSPEASLSAPKARKHIEGSRRLTPLEFLSLKLGSVNQARTWGFAGCCYCMRGTVMRRIWFPEGMIGEDAFLNGLIITDLCRSKEPRYDRVVGAPDATVVFEAYTTVGKAFKTLRRQAVTRGMNAILWDYLWSSVGEHDAGEVIRRRAAEDPEWFRKLVLERVGEGGWWVMPKGVLLRRMGYLKNVTLGKAVTLFPWALAGSMVDLVVNVDANMRLKRGQIGGLWQTTRTTKI